MAANLRLPRSAGRAPLVVLIPGLDSTKEEFFAWESVFLARGMATLSLDGPGQGETGFELDIRPDYEVAVRAILDAVAGRAELDHDRIGAAGVSLGGHYVVRAAAFEPRLKAIASISGPYDFAAGWDSMPSLTRAAVAHHTGARDEAQARERAHELDLAGVADRVSQPCLVVTGARDRVISWEQTKRIADDVPEAEWFLYEDGTHVCNNIPFKYRPLVADWMREHLGVIGDPVRRREDARFLLGQARYVDDIELEGAAQVAFVRSPHAHASITQIRTPDRADGLIAVITAADLDGVVRPFALPTVDGGVVAEQPHPVLARDEVRYVGQPVAAVLASTRALAEDAAELVKVTYQPRDAVVSPGDSTVELLRWTRRGGDVEDAFQTAARVVHGSYGLPRLAAAPIETRGAIALYDPGGDLLTVVCSAQDPHRPRAQLAHILGRPVDSVRVIVPDVGGAFGSKGVIACEIAAVAAAAITVGVPVKWTEDRTENLLATYQGRGISGEIELALSPGGRMLGLRARLLADLGAYLLPTTTIPPLTAAMLITGCYEIEAAEVRVLGVQTNKVPTGPYRGAGRPDAAYLLERTVDRAARELGIDRVELRRRNLIRRFPHRTALGFEYDSGDFERCLELAAELSDSADDDVSGDDDVSNDGAGTGIALYVERAGGQWESATVALSAGGRFEIATSACAHGQGHETTFAQIAAERLGVASEQIAISYGDSAEVPPGVGTFGSRSVAMAGSAIVAAIDELIELAMPVASRLLGASAAFEAGRFSGGGREVSLAELGPLRSQARFESPLVFSSGAHAATVKINRETGELRVLRVVAVDDSGTVINPLLVHGQVVGGVAQALGECLVEEVVYDQRGENRSSSLAEYSLPTAAEMPTIVTGEVSSPTPLNPLGAKGAGEGGTVGALPAIANAVTAALAGHELDPPYTAEKLWRSLR